MIEKDRDIERKRERESERHLRPQGREVKARAVESLLRRSAHLNIFYFPLNPPLFPSDQHQNQFVIEIAGDKTVPNETQVKSGAFYMSLSSYSYLTNVVRYIIQNTVDN